MNLFFLDSIEKETYGGMEEWIGLIADGLVSRGHNVTVAGREGSEFLRRIVKFNGKIKCLPMEISGDFNPVTVAELKNRISKNNIDLVIVNFNKDVRLGGIAAKLDRKTKVIWSVGLDITKDSFVHRHLTPKLIEGVIVPSVALAKQIAGSGYIDRKIIEVIPIGIAEKEIQTDKEAAQREVRKRYNIPTDRKIAITVGRFVNQKGHKFLIEAAAKIVQKYKNITFLLIGDGPLRNDIVNAITKYNLEEHFFLTGMMDWFDLELLGSDLMIHPSIEEPFGIAVLEGMRASLPIVASNVGGIPEVVEENITAILVPSSDSGALANTVLDLLNKPDKMSEMGKAGYRRWQNEFRLENMVDRVEAYFQRQLSLSRCS